ncbi:MFS transporter [Bordetella hinzii]|uniref:MFS transporter n=1 Tax=Bordetella hinzii TaxID=103855 RepID=UPI001C02D24B|nr:MFS transporter [Bordetella hinzii]QWF43634.1 MFS transporter [Bordetella hinzii]QWF48172.1 MFS transporter [Bordetella hinzii]QWF52709.1 MFS transporter [Bordetella hinzii]QWF57198.1 MFS transporter [Bordetella hinzii]
MPTARDLPTPLVALFAVACGISVANVYYAQPLLDALAADFGIARGAVGGVITATQIGCGLALLFVVPLGDIWPRKRLLLVQLVLLAFTLLALAASRHVGLLLAGMLALGLLGTAMTQGLIVYAAAAAGEHQRGAVVGAAQGGVMAGLLLARTVSGLIADLAGWRAVYLVSALFCLLLSLCLARLLPPPAPAQAMRYRDLLASLAGQLRRNPVLRARGLLGFWIFAVLGLFWSAMALPLADAGLSTAAIGAFGLLGVAGALGAARAGRLADQGHAQATTGWALALMLLSWLPLAALGQSLWWLGLGIVLLDLAAQAVHVTNQSLILAAPPALHGRLIGGYMLFYAAGSGAGALFTTHLYAWAGWPAVCAAGAAASACALLCWRRSAALSAENASPARASRHRPAGQ